MSYNQVNSEGNKEGLHISFYDTGQLFDRSNFINGKLEGPYEQYWSNGKLFFKVFYINNKKEGPIEYYTNRGRLLFEGTYKNGKLNAFTILYEKNKLKIKQFYVN